MRILAIRAFIAGRKPYGVYAQFFEIIEFLRDSIQIAVSKDKSRAYVVGERMLYMPCDYDVTLCLAGLDGEKTYRIRELNITALVQICGK